MESWPTGGFAVVKILFPGTTKV